MATIDVSPDELTGATIIITRIITAIISTTDRSRDRDGVSVDRQPQNPKAFGLTIPSTD